jgi:peptidoglycan hydrolase-like protein with peptidoglycan-binding domain
VDEDEFEFEFFPDPPEPPEEHEAPLNRPRSEEIAPRPRRHGRSTHSDAIRRRRVTAAAAAVGLLLLIILVVVLTSGSGGGSGGSYSNYLTKLSPIASNSEQVGSSLAADLSAARKAGARSSLVGKLDALVQQTTGQLGSLESLQTPTTLTSQQAQALAALDLRLRGLQGLRDAVSQGLSSPGDAAWSAVASAQVNDLRTSDVLWDSARTSANDVLRAHGGGFVPSSHFVADPGSLQRSIRTLLGGAGVATTGRNLSLGSTGADVVAWQNALNRWLRLAAPTQTALTADGNFGAGTQTATEQLQTAAGLTPDGVVGASTRRALQQALAAGKTPSTQTTPAAATLKLGDTGSAIVSWQNQLNRWLKNTAATQPPLTADGSFGSSTQTVTEQFQSAAQLTPTGQVDAATQRAMTAALARSG